MTVYTRGHYSSVDPTASMQTGREFLRIVPVVALPAGGDRTDACASSLLLVFGRKDHRSSGVGSSPHSEGPEDCKRRCDHHRARCSHRAFDGRQGHVRSSFLGHAEVSKPYRQTDRRPCYLRSIPVSDFRIPSGDCVPPPLPPFHHRIHDGPHCRDCARFAYHFARLFASACLHDPNCPRHDGRASQPGDIDNR